jgi:hypothetical protein
MLITVQIYRFEMRPALTLGIPLSYSGGQATVFIHVVHCSFFQYWSNGTSFHTRNRNGFSRLEIQMVSPDLKYKTAVLYVVRRYQLK